VHTNLAAAVAGDIDDLHRHIHQLVGFDRFQQRARRAVGTTAWRRARDDFDFAHWFPSRHELATLV
jgi:hypothetical protein